MLGRRTSPSTEQRYGPNLIRCHLNLRIGLVVAGGLDVGTRKSGDDVTMKSAMF